MEVTFAPDKKHRDKVFTRGHFAHPAKMMLPLQRWIVDRYTKPGDVILDPMAGSGTLLVATQTGRHVILVELEEKFIKMIKDNWVKVQMVGPEMACEMGTAQVIQGDARNLEALSCDVIVSSPPHGGNSEPYMSKELLRIRQAIGRDPNAPSQQSAGYGDNPENVGNLRYGNIDCVISSPPYERQIHLTHETTENVIATNDPKHLGEFSQPMLVDGYGAAADNIGNLKGESYLEAMLQVYQGCHRVLKPLGLMILVTKNFIRNKEIVRLDEDTIRLCQEAGFDFVERHCRNLTSQSFWRRIYRQKYPNAPKVDTEDILVFRK